ncbi:MAG: polysaccharide deacetylase family protein, partial [Acetivibrio ethanolgignens]
MIAKSIRVGLLLAACFFAGRFSAMAVDRFLVQPTAQGQLQSAEGNWGLSFQEEGQPPVANATFEELAKYNAYYAEDTKEKVLYLTFDAGYENGNTPAILEALKKHNVKATFFIVGNYLKTSPELVKQML